MSIVFSFSFSQNNESVPKLSVRLGRGFSSNFDFVNTIFIFLFLSYFRKLGFFVKLLIFGFAKWSRRSLKPSVSVSVSV